MKVYNVLFKPTHLSYSEFNAKVFAAEEEADAWINKMCEVKGLRICSQRGWDEDHTIDDRRCEDKDGNDYFFIILVQELKLTVIL